MSFEVEIGRLIFKNPIIVGSAGYTEDENGLRRFIKRGYGGVVTKSTSKKSLAGSPPPRVFWYDPYRKSWLNGDEAHRNPGIEKMAESVKECKSLADENNCRIIGSVSFDSIEEAVYVATEFEKAGVSAVEVDIGCPVVGPHLGPEYARRGTDWGNPKNLERDIELIKTIKAAVDIPVWPKLSPTTLFIVGKKIEQATNPEVFVYQSQRFPTHPLGLAIDIETGQPLFSGNTLLKIKKGMKFTPSIGVFPMWPTTILVTALLKKNIKAALLPSGGLSRGFDVIQAMMAGANAVEVCTAIYRDLNVIECMLREMGWFMSKKGYTDLRTIVGMALEHIPFDLMDIPIAAQ